jgi:hypothetical protein
VKIKRLERGESGGLRRLTCRNEGWGRSRGMEIDRKRFELNQGRQASDKVIWRKICGMWDLGKVELDEIIGG